MLLLLLLGGGGGGGGVENNVTSTIIQISVPIAIDASTWIQSSGYYECFFSTVKHGFLQKMSFDEVASAIQ